jgi:hypothetical protein
MLLEISEIVVFNERRIFISLEKNGQLEEETMLKVETNYFFSIMIPSKGDFEFSALLYTPHYASSNDPDEMYPVYFKIFTGEKKIVMLE